MPKSYDLSKKSDVKRLSKDLPNLIRDKAVEALHDQTYEIECPECGAKISVPPGKSSCPKCHEVIDLQLNIKF